MKRYAVFILCCLMFTLGMFAQASGGQITRKSEKTSPRRNVVKISEADGFVNGHGYVDLGLPSKTKWATCNVGANFPEDYGYYLAWGETEPKNRYAWKDTPLYGVPIDNISYSENYDAAKIKWGNGWSIPTKYQWDELIRYCKLKVTKKNGINGLLLIGKNGKSVFFPSGGRKLDTLLQFESCDGYYWSSNADYKYQGNPAYAPDGYSTSFHTTITSTGMAFPDTEWRGYGLNIRPVTK